jgi:hypothetical protein
MFRKIFLTSKFLQPLECVAISFFTVTFWFWTPYLANATCQPTDNLNSIASDLTMQYNCPKYEYSPMASLMFSSQGDIIRAIIVSFYPNVDDEVTLTLTTGNLLVFFGLWYTFTLFTYGVWIPSGILLPGMVIGCVVGALYNNL